MGIHTGPVYRVADVNANANVSGGGINIAQRVMDCGDAGHILVSKTVADVLSQLSDWAPCLCDLGEHPVKHGVSVHIYNLATADAGNAATPAKLAKTAPVAKKSKAPLAVGVAAAVLLAAGGGWFLTRQKAATAVPVAAPIVEPLSLKYTIEHDPAEEGIAFDVKAPTAGFLYVLNYGQDKDKWTINLLHPLHSEEAKRGAGQTLRVPPHGWFTPNVEGDRNDPYLVWSENAVSDIEDLKLLPQKDGVAVVADPKRVKDVLQYLKTHLATDVVHKGDLTEVHSKDQVLVHEISLDGK
jgi:hypothetical protein